MENSNTINALVDNLDASIENLEEALQPYLETSLEETLAKCSTPEEKAKAYNELLYITDSVLFALLNTSGIKTESHPIRSELARTQQSMKRLKEVKQQLENKKSQADASNKKTAEFLQNTLGTTGGLAAPDSLKSPAISSANFKGKHTKF